VQGFRQLSNASGEVHPPHQVPAREFCAMLDGLERVTVCDGVESAALKVPKTGTAVLSEGDVEAALWDCHSRSHERTALGAAAGCRDFDFDSHWSAGLNFTGRHRW